MSNCRSHSSGHFELSFFHDFLHAHDGWEFGEESFEVAHGRSYSHAADDDVGCGKITPGMLSMYSNFFLRNKT
ncbi:hypothetical protein U1Q18_011323 [Sarracenia purpurea var. burkii]